MNLPVLINTLDHSIFEYINHGISNSIFDEVFPVLRNFTYLFWMSLIVYFWIKKEKKLALLLTGGILAGAFFTYFIKFLIDRARPYEQLESTRLLTPFENDPSFPSGHSEMSFLASTIVSQFHPGMSKYLYPFSFLVAFSRIYVGVHFPTDVMGGMIIGLMIGNVMLKTRTRL